MSKLRSLLFAPGNHPRRMEKAPTIGADAVIIDLEDAVPISEKMATRDRVRQYLAGHPGGEIKRFVRINGLRTPFAVGDVEAIAIDGLDGIVLPKVECAGDLQVIDALLGHWECERGLPAGHVEIMPIIETAKGLVALGEITRATRRLHRVSFGSGDFSLDTGSPWARDNPVLFASRVQVAIASRSAELEPPVDTVFPIPEDESGLEEEAREARKMGYQGKMAIHPRQIPLINEIFTPTSGEVTAARKIVAAFEEAERSGSAAIVVNGVFVDYPVVYNAQRVLARAADFGKA